MKLEGRHYRKGKADIGEREGIRANDRERWGGGERVPLES